ncbi:MAG: sigma-70 family RNA polymerase sigma factor [Fibrella sp.]|nr:sigma-70 family RNA polymerase sigma factor [Armatimonadota bacterium]
MNEHQWLAERFEQNRERLGAVAYRMLGSRSEADDAVQESWLRLNRSDLSGVENLEGWLTTVAARVCLDMLRARKSRGEESLEMHVRDHIADGKSGTDPEQEALLADSVGLALLVVLEKLAPAERLAFVLHDMFAVSFDEIGQIVGRSPTAARQLASRARRRVRGTSTAEGSVLRLQREVIEAFLAASRCGDFGALLAVLDPDVVLRADGPVGTARVIRGATGVAGQAFAFSGRAGFARTALVNGNVGVVVAPRGRLLVAFQFRVIQGKIAEIDVVTAPERFGQLDLAVLDD